MNSNNELLNYIFQNSEMGKETIKKLLDIVENKEFKEELTSELNEYITINDKAMVMIEEVKREPKKINPIAKISANITLDMKTMINSSVEHIAEMMIQGSTMGIIDITKKLKQYDTKNDDIAKLGNDLLKLEESNFSRLRNFL